MVLEAIQPIQSSPEESVSFKGLIQTKRDLEEFVFKNNLHCCLKNKAMKEPPL